MALCECFFSFLSEVLFNDGGDDVAEGPVAGEDVRVGHLVMRWRTNNKQGSPDGHNAARVLRVWH